jgi:hypothetical protein
VLEYALRFDADSLDDLALVRESQDYRCPLLVVPAGVSFEPPLALEGEVVFSCLKGAQDGRGLVLRVFNPGSVPATARVVGAGAIERCRLDESPGQTVGGDTIEVAPGQIATLRLRAPVHRYGNVFGGSACDRLAGSASRHAAESSTASMLVANCSPAPTAAVRAGERFRKSGQPVEVLGAG